MKTIKIPFYMLLTQSLFCCKTSKDSISLSQQKTEKRVSLSLSPNYKPSDTVTLNIPIKIVIKNGSDSDIKILDWKLNLDKKIRGWDTHRILTENGKDFVLGNEILNKKKSNIYSVVVSYPISVNEASNILKNRQYENLAVLKKSSDSIQLSSKKIFFNDFPLIYNSLNKMSDSIIFITGDSNSKGTQLFKKKIVWLD